MLTALAESQRNAPTVLAIMNITNARTITIRNALTVRVRIALPIKDVLTILPTSEKLMVAMQQLKQAYKQMCQGEFKCAPCSKTSVTPPPETS